MHSFQNNVIVHRMKKDSQKVSNYCIIYSYTVLYTIVYIIFPSATVMSEYLFLGSRVFQFELVFLLLELRTAISTYR